MTNSVKLHIKRVFKGENLNYSLGIVENPNLYVMELIDTTGFIMGIPGQTSKLEPATAVFGITKEEFDLKDNDVSKLDDLAFELMHKLPKDRIIAENNLRKEDRAETIDGGKYATEKMAELEQKKKDAVSESASRAKALIGSMFESGQGWYVYTKGAGNKLPTIDSSGAVQIFTKEEYANLVVEKAVGVPLAVEKLDPKTLGSFFTNLFRFGILRIKVDVLQQGGGETGRDAVARMGELKEYQLMNSRCCFLMIRYLQTKQLQDKTQANLGSATVWNAFCKEFPKSLFFVPMCFEGEEGATRDEKEMYFTQSAAEKMRTEKPAFLGIDKYKPADGNGRKIKFITLKNKVQDEDKMFFPVFTDIGELKAVFGDRAKLCMITYTDLLEKYKSCFAVVVNPATLNLVITEKGMENIEQEKDGPVKIFKLDPNAKNKE
ncbi:MAG: SseB family protein [Clostridia bacterium]|nr:SseB family protein [Clostridia bacterium]